MGARSRSLCGRLVIAFALASAASAAAAELPASDGEGDAQEDPLQGGGEPSRELEVHGFVSPGWIKSFRNDFLAKGSSAARGSFEFSEAGLNFTLPVAERLRAGIQLFARDLGPIGSYDAKFDWYYLDYRPQDWLGLRGGRTKLPFGLYNEIYDVDAARQPILLPPSIYPLRNRDFQLAQTGFELYGHVSAQRAGGFEYRLYGGTIGADVNELEAARSPELQGLTFDAPYLWGGRLLWSTPLEGLRIGPSLVWTRFDLAALVAGAPLRVSLPGFIWLASAEYLTGELTIAAEYGRWRVDQQSSNPLLVPSAETTSERYYVQVAYRLSAWFQPGVYYSVFFGDTSRREPREARQRDTALSLRFDLNEHWLAKLEGHYQTGTAGTTSDVNGGVPLSQLDERWGTILVKSTIYF